MGNKTNLRDQRLRALATILTWEGELSNKRIRELFGLQNVQASRLIAEFRATFSELINDDESRRVMVLNVDHVRKSLIEDYVSILHDVEGDSVFIEDIRADLAPISPPIFSVIRNACLNKSGANIKYASMTHPEGTERIIFPHTIVRAGRRWHVRAWCGLRNEYRDFAFGRIRQADFSNTKLDKMESDSQWKTIINLRLAAHSGLNDNQARVVRDEYFEGNSEKVIQTRACLASYLLQELRVAIDVDKQLPPEFQLEVANLKDVKKYLWG